MKLLSVTIAISLCSGAAVALDNGLGLTPIMGWLSWQRYRCVTDCQNNPDQCISESLYKRMADRLVADGYRDAGYVYVNIDDCWSLKERDNVTKRLVADPERFPSGIAALAKYMHDRGLKLGIYGDAGTSTCAGYPGSQGYFDLDAQTFAEWGVDSVKIDGCYIDENSLGDGFPQMAAALNKTGRPIFHSCCAQYIKKPNFTKISEACNIWRPFEDVNDSWTSIKSIVDFFVKHQDTFVPVARPGAFYDPDMLVIGDFGLSLDQSRTQMALWAIFASPLLMSNNLEQIGHKEREILLNRHVIEVNQDPAGVMGKLRYRSGKLNVFVRSVQPFINKTPSLAIAIVNSSEGGGPIRYTLNAEDLELNNPKGYFVTDLFDNNRLLTIIKPKDSLVLDVNPSGVRFIKATAIGEKGE